MAKTVITTVVSLITILFLATTPPSTAEIKSLTITSDTRPMILFEKFGFTHSGHVRIAVSEVSVAAGASQPDPSSLGFFLLNEESLLQVLIEIQQNPSFCVLNSHYITTLFTFRDLSPPPTASFNRSYPVTYPNEFSLFFANCVPETSVSMAVRTELFNLDADKSRDYLSAGQTQLPTLFFLFSIVYLGFLGVWFYVCYNNKRSVHRIHLLMAALLLMKALNLICAAEDKHYVKITGTPHGWDVLFYIFQFIRVVLLFTVIVLIGTGWSFLKPFLQEREKKVLMVVIPLQVLANLASVIIGETGPFIKDWVTWNQVFLLVDIICCCAIIFPIVWSIKSLRETSKTDGKAARNLAKLTLFRQFYIVVIGYLYFTRIVVFALKTITAYKYRWVSNLAEQKVNINSPAKPAAGGIQQQPTKNFIFSFKFSFLIFFIGNSDTQLRKVKNFEEILKKKTNPLSKKNCSGYYEEVVVIGSEAKRRRKMLFCGKGSRNGVVLGSVPVYLNVYDLTQFNGYAYWFGLGVYHSGVQVHDVEYAFGAHEHASTGIFEGEPKKCEGFRYRKTILIGKTDKDIDEVRDLMIELAAEYKGNAYNLITKNCNHFCNDACLRLTGNSIPSWVNRLARIGFICNCVLPVTLNSTKVRHHHRIEDKQCEHVKHSKQTTSEQPNKVTISNSTPSTTSSPASTSSGLRRGRSRTRRRLPPPSPLINCSPSS